jgi:hypothetical protein
MAKGDDVRFEENSWVFLLDEIAGLMLVWLPQEPCRRKEALNTEPTLFDAEGLLELEWDEDVVTLSRGEAVGVSVSSPPLVASIEDCSVKKHQTYNQVF